MRLALALCPSWDLGYAGSGLALLTAWLKAAGHEPELLDLNLEIGLMERALGRAGAWNRATPADPWTDETAVRETFAPYRAYLEGRVQEALGRGCRLFGFSVYASNLAFTRELARLVKRLSPQARVVFGGPACLTRRECLEHLRHDCVDAVVFGEADLALPRLVSDLEKGGRLRAGPGVMLRSDESTWKTEPAVLERLDDLPHADFSAYRHLARYRGKTLHTTRGCVRRCNFCADWREMPFRVMTGRRIFEEADLQVRLHPDKTDFMFGDSVLNASLPSLREFCGLAAERALPITWRGYAIARPDLDAQTLALMKRAGCASLMFGVESGSAAVLKAMDKGVPPEVNARSLERSRAAGIDAVATWIVGFPAETDEAFEESLSFVRRHASSISLLTPSLFSIAELKSQADRFGLDAGDDDVFWSTRDGRNTFPVRMDRLLRLVKAADESGVPVSYQGKLSAAELGAYRDRALAQYESHRRARSA